MQSRGDDIIYARAAVLYGDKSQSMNGRRRVSFGNGFFFNE